MLYWTLALSISTLILAAVAVAAAVKLAMGAVAPPLVIVPRLQCHLVVAQCLPWYTVV